MIYYIRYFSFFLEKTENFVNNGLNRCKYNIENKIIFLFIVFVTI